MGTTGTEGGGRQLPGVSRSHRNSPRVGSTASAPLHELPVERFQDVRVSRSSHHPDSSRLRSARRTPEHSASVSNIAADIRTTKLLGNGPQSLRYRATSARSLMGEERPFFNRQQVTNAGRLFRHLNDRCEVGNALQVVRIGKTSPVFRTTDTRHSD